MKNNILVNIGKKLKITEIYFTVGVLDDIL